MNVNPDNSVLKKNKIYLKTDEFRFCLESIQLSLIHIFNTLSVLFNLVKRF